IHRVVRALDVLFQAVTQLAVIAKGVECGRRNGVDRIWPDQLLDIDDIAIARILGARARPEYALRLRSLLREPLPARAAEALLVGRAGAGAPRGRAHCSGERTMWHW